MCSASDKMPRSFLVKNYFKRSESDENEQDNKKGEEVKKEFVQSDQLNLLSYPTEYLEYAASLLALSKSNWLHWDYELEKSYWFDTSAKVEGVNTETPLTNSKQDDTIDDPKGEETEEEDEKPVLTELTPVKPSDAAQYAAFTNLTKRVENQTNPSFQNIGDTFSLPNVIADISVAAKIDLESAEKISPLKFPLSESSSSSPSINTSPENNLTWEENIEEKLNQMLGEDIEVVTRNIRQFLDNNRILIDEITLETGIGKDTIQSYIEHGTMVNDECKRDFYRWYLLKVLRPPNENSGDSYTCYKCGKIFTYKSYLERHIKYVCPDSSGRTWKCSFCGKAFQYPCYLRRHVRSHTGESPYKCDKCDRAFVRSTDLQRHIRNHTGEKPYCCQQCSRAFARSTDLKRHMRTHTGEKPYKCWQCGKSFSQSGSLQTHLHTHNKESILPKAKKIK